jgi:hypothetical protein
VRQAFAGTVTHPIVVGCDAVEFDSRHVHTPPCERPSPMPIGVARTAD